MIAVDENGAFRFGRYEQPFERLNFHEADLSDVSGWWGRPQSGWLGRTVRRMRLKKWHYVGICHPEYYLCAAVADLGYVGNTFCYLVERESGECYQTEALLPLGLGVQVADTARGSTQAKGIQLQHEGFEWTLELDVRLKGNPLRARLTFPAGKPLSLLYPLHSNRAAHTHKEVAVPCQGHLWWKDRTVDLGNALAGIDYTHSYANRRTDWHWLFLTGTLTDGSIFGLNLSEKLYRDAENFVWLQGEPHHVGGARIVPSTGAEWRINGPQIDIAFHPLGERCQNVRVGLIGSQFRQPYGEAEGSITVAGESHKIASAFGVAEEHHALW